MKGIYKITCKINNKSYIGKSRNIINRWQNHIYNGLTCNYNSCEHELYKDIKKYGIENFTFEILELAENDYTFHTENDYIIKYDTIKNGYNIRPGSQEFDFYDNAPLHGTTKYLFKLEKDDNIIYFDNYHKIADYFNVGYDDCNLIRAVNGDLEIFKNYNFEKIIDDGTIIPKYINPEP